MPFLRQAIDQVSNKKGMTETPKETLEDKTDTFSTTVLVHAVML